MSLSFREKMLVGVCAGSLLFAGTYSADAQIATVDAAALGEWAISIADDAKAYALQIEQYATQVKDYVGDELSWVKQAAQYATQLQQYAQEIQLFMNFFHNPSLGAALGLMGMAGLGNSLPINPYALMSLMNGLQYGSGGFGEITGLLSSLSTLAGASYTSNHVYTPMDGSFASNSLIGNGNSLSGEQGAATAAYGDARTHSAVLPALRDNLLAASDTKGVLDASAQIQAETAWNVNQMVQLQAADITANAQDRWVVQRENEHLACDLEAFIGRGANCPNTTTGTAGQLMTAAATAALPTPPVPPAGGDPATVIDTPPAPPAVVPVTAPVATAPATPTFADTNNPANNDAALQNVVGGDGQESNLAGPTTDVPVLALPPGD